MITYATFKGTLLENKGLRPDADIYARLKDTNSGLTPDELLDEQLDALYPLPSPLDSNGEIMEWEETHLGRLVST